MRITKSTADAVIQSLYPHTADLLKRFEEVKRVANVADGERDRLREFIQKHVPQGKYDDVIITKSDTAEQVYVNAEGKHALKNYGIIDGCKPESGIEVAVLATKATTADQLVAELLHVLQAGKEKLVEHVAQLFLGYGLSVDNDALYLEKGGTKIEIVVLPGGADNGSKGPV